MTEQFDDPSKLRKTYLSVISEMNIDELFDSEPQDEDEISDYGEHIYRGEAESSESLEDWYEGGERSNGGEIGSNSKSDFKKFKFKCIDESELNSGCLDINTLGLAIVYILSLWGDKNDEQECLSNLKLFNKDIWDLYYKGVQGEVSYPIEKESSDQDDVKKINESI